MTVYIVLSVLMDRSLYIFSVFSAVDDFHFLPNHTACTHACIVPACPDMLYPTLGDSVEPTRRNAHLKRGLLYLLLLKHFPTVYTACLWWLCTDMNMFLAYLATLPSWYIYRQLYINSNMLAISCAPFLVYRIILVHVL